MSDLERLTPVLGDLLDVYDPIEGHDFRWRSPRRGLIGRWRS